MNFEAGDLDRAMGELLHLFAYANRVGFCGMLSRH